MSRFRSMRLSDGTVIYGDTRMFGVEHGGFAMRHARNGNEMVRPKEPAPMKIKTLSKPEDRERVAQIGLRANADGNVDVLLFDEDGHQVSGGVICTISTEVFGANLGGIVICPGIWPNPEYVLRDGMFTKVIGGNLQREPLTRPDDVVSSTSGRTHRQHSSEQ